jgi:hypothetical protein
MRPIILVALVFLWAPAVVAEEPWYRAALIGMEVGPSGKQGPFDATGDGYAAQLNGADIVAKQIEVGSQYLVIWGRDGDWAFYDSKLMPKCPGLGERDVVREAVEAARAHGLPIIVYVVVQSGGHALKEHPEFGMAALDRTPIEGRVCLNGPYRDYVMALLDELLAYGINGFHVDMVDQGFGPPYGCACEVCLPLFEERYAHVMPMQVNWDEAWDHMLEFRYDTSARFERDVVAHVKASHPEVSVDFNYHGYPPFSFEVGQRPKQHAHIGDFVTCESGVWGFGALGVNMTAEFVRACGAERPYQVVMQRGTRFYHDQTTRPLHDLRWEMLTLLAHGAQVTIVDKTPYSGVMDPVAYGRIGTVFAEVHAKRTHFGQPPQYDVGILYSTRTRDWFAREDRWRYMEPFLGMHKAFCYEHIPCGIVLEEGLTAEHLATFPVIAVPNAAILEDATVALLTGYVKNGGRLLISGVSGCYDRMGTPREDSSLAALSGGHVRQIAPNYSNYVRLAQDSPFLEDVPAGWPHLVHGPAVVLEAAGAKAFDEMLLPIKREAMDRNGWTSSAEEAVGPAALWNEVGEGRVLTLAVSPDAATAGEYRTSEARLFLRNALRMLHPAPSVKIDAPRYVETVITRDKTGTIRVHFLGYLVPPGTTGEKRPWVIPDLIEDLPLYRATVTFDATVAHAHAINDDTQLQVNKSQVELTINDVHEVLVVDLQTAEASNGSSPLE